jgi:hypothetical protein
MNPGDADLLHREYAAVRRAVRMVGTAAVLLLLGWFFVESRTIPDYTDIFENMVQGGQEALPPLTKVVLARPDLIFLAVSALSLGLVGIMWGCTRHLSTAIWLSFGAVSLPLAGLIVFRMAMFQPLITVITKFQG